MLKIKLNRGLVYLPFVIHFMSLANSVENFSSQFHIPITKYELKNGMRVVLNPDKKTPIASYILGYDSGSRHERPGLTGLSHMFEHLMFKGTKKYPHFSKVYAEEGLIRVNAFTSHDYTAYLASFPPEKLELVLDVESDRMRNLTFTQQDLDKERKAVQEERLLRTDNNPRGFLMENMFDLLFVKHPYRWPVIGYAKDIAGYSLQDLKTWYNSYYTPNQAVLVISGNFSLSQAKKGIEKHFGPLARKDPPQELKIKEPEQTSARSRTIYRDVKAPLAAMVYQTPPAGSKEFYALEFISHILGSGESSVLYKKMVRDQKLLSSISSSAWDFTDHGLFLIYYSLQDISKEEEVKQLILKEVKAFKDSLNAQSLEKVKNIKINEMIYYLKRSMGRARMILDHEMTFKDWTKIYEKMNFLNQVSLDFIQEVGEKYLSPDKLSYLILKAPLDAKNLNLKKEQQAP